VLAKVFSGYADEGDRERSALLSFAATMDVYLLQAASYLRGSGYPGSVTAINTPVQKATAQSDVQALDSFFGTPGLMS